MKKHLYREIATLKWEICGGTFLGENEAGIYFKEITHKRQKKLNYSKIFNT